MKKNITRGIEKAIYLVAVLFVCVFGACTDEHYGTGEKTTPEPPVIKGDTIVSFDDAFKFNHAEWNYSNGLAKADNFYDGYINYTVDGNVVKTDLIDHQIAPMEMIWTPMEETTSSSAEKMYIGQKAGAAKTVETGKNQAVSLSKYERECKISFVGTELTIKGSWWLASLGKDIRGCQYDSTTIVTQVQDTVKVNGAKIEVVVDGNKYNRVNVTAKALNHFTDLPAKTAHSEKMDIIYSTLVPVSFTPGDKIYEGSTAIEGTGTYVKVTSESYKSSIKLTHYLTQDGNTLKEEEAVSGIASVKTWVEGKAPKEIINNIKIGNPTVSVETTISDLYLIEGFIYAKKYTTVWTYKWVIDGIEYTKKVFSEVERLYYMREKGKEVAMPFGETTTSFKTYIEGNPAEKSEGSIKYNAYVDGMLYFNGEHKSETGNLKDAISGLEIGQEFWIEIADEFLGFDVNYTEAQESNNWIGNITITSRYSASGTQVLSYDQKFDFSFTVSDYQRKFGDSMNLESALSESADNPSYKPAGQQDLFVRTLTKTYTAKFDLCVVKAFAKETEAYVLFRGTKYFFKAKKAEVTYKGTNDPDATEVTVDYKKYSRKSYVVTFSHNILGKKTAEVDVDKLLPAKPDVPDEWGPIDITRTKQFARISWAWDAQGKSFPSATIITANGIVSVWNNQFCFTKMNTAEIKDKLGNALWPESSNYLIPSYINIPTKPNKHWVYSDIFGQDRDEVFGTLIEKLPEVSLDKPFFGEPSETSETFKIVNHDGSVQIIIKYDNMYFDHVFKK